MGLYGIVVVTTAPAGATAGTAYPGHAYPAVTYNAEVPLLLSEIDPVQNNAVQAAVNTAGFSETTVWSGQPGGCGNPACVDLPSVLSAGGELHAAVLPHQRQSHSTRPMQRRRCSRQLPRRLPPVTGNVLVRMVNAGLRMHVPSIVGAQTGIAGCGLRLDCGRRQSAARRTRVQSEVWPRARRTM